LLFSRRLIAPASYSSYWASYEVARVRDAEELANAASLFCSTHYSRLLSSMRTSSSYTVVRWWI
jgi:hypothetical protein